VPMAGMALVEHLPGSHLQSGKQRRGAMPEVIRLFVMKRGVVPC